MKKKVLFVASEFAPGMIPFAATIINTMANCHELEVHCLCVNSGKCTYKGLIRATANPVFVEYPQSKLKKLYYKFWPVSIIKALNRLRHEIKPDVVHFLTGDFTLANYAHLHKSPSFYYTVHDLHPHEVNKDNFFQRMFHKYIMSSNERMHRRIDNLTTSSLSQIEELRQLYPTKNIQFTHFPTLVTEKIAYGKMGVKELNEIQHYILFFGNVDVYKGVDLLVKAFTKSGIKEKCKLVIAGRGYLKIQSNDNIVRIDRFIEDEELGELFKNARFVVYPYRSVTMSGVLSLAFYFHKRVLLSNIPFFKENACELTSFFKNGDIGDLEKMLDCLLDKEKMAFDNCYDRIYSRAVLIRDYLKLYNV